MVNGRAKVEKPIIMPTFALLNQSPVSMFRLLCSILALLPFAASAQDYSYTRYEGTVASKPVVLHLQRHVRPDYSEGQTISSTQYNGVYYYTQYDMPISVFGSIDEKGMLQLTEYTGGMQLKANGKGGLIGTWISTDGTKQFPVALTEGYPTGSVAFDGSARYERKPLFTQRDNSPGMEVHLAWLEPDGKLPATTRTFIRENIHLEMVGKSLRCCPGIQKAFETMRDEQFRMYNDEFRETLKEDPEMPEHMMNFLDQQSVMVLYNSNYLLSLGFNHSFYSGGAHGNFATTTRSYNLKTLKAVALADVLKPGYEKALDAALDKSARNYMSIAPQDPINSAYLVDRIPPTDNFYLTGKGIVFSYPPYEIAPYAGGQVELFVSFADLRNWVK